MQEITGLQEYGDILKNTQKHDKQYVFIYFYADWCGPQLICELKLTNYVEQPKMR